LRKFEVAYPPNRDVRAGVRVSDERTYVSENGPRYETAEGEVHDLSAGPVHMSSPSGAGGITLAVMSPRFSDRAYFYAPSLEGGEQTVRPEEIGAMMDIVADARRTLR
jgi:hypothetical protein